MLDQTFSLIDIPRLAVLTFLEGVLSLDNALALALIARFLPNRQRKRALFIGLISAFALRAIGILAAAYMIGLLWIQVAGGVYLIGLALFHLKQKQSTGKQKSTRGKSSFWKTVALLELTDFMFAIDSILMGVALIGIHFTPPKLPPKIWIVYFGGVIGIIAMRFAAKLFINLIERFPGLESGAHLIVGWIGMKLLVEACLKAFYQKAHIEMSNWIGIIFWIGIIACVILSLFFKKKEK